MTEKEKMVAAFKKQPRADQYELIKTFEKITEEEEVNLEKEKIQSNLSFFGKCYKYKYDLEEDYTYFKVISPFGGNEYHVSMLSFPAIPKLSLVKRISLMSNIALNGKVELKSFNISKVFINSKDRKVYFFPRFEEISEEEWKEAFDKHCKLLKELKHNYSQEEAFIND